MSPSGTNHAVTDSDWLPRLATDINREHELAEESARDAVGSACRAGKLLIQAKRKVGHGKWELWVEDNLKLASSTARSYMRVAGKLGRMPVQQAEHIKSLSLRDAIEHLREPTEKKGSQKKQRVSAKTLAVSVLNPPATASESPTEPPAAPAPEPEEPNTATGNTFPKYTFGIILGILAEIFQDADGDDGVLWAMWARVSEADRPEVLRDIDSRIKRLVELHRRLSGGS